LKKAHCRNEDESEGYFPQLAVVESTARRVNLWIRESPEHCRTPSIRDGG